MGDPVVWFELGAGDEQTLVSFYRELFGWAMQPVPGGPYTLIDTHGGSGINGGIGRSRSGSGAPWSTFYVGVRDLQATLEKAESLGGRTAMPIEEIPQMVTFAMIEDPDGLLVGLLAMEPPQDGAAPGPSAGDGAAVDWFEVIGADAERTQRFYTELFGWELASAGFPGYGLVDTKAGLGIQGGLGGSGDSRWATIYASVPDVERALARAEELGGGRVYGPMAVGEQMQTGALRDPAGNVFGVYHGR
jgi:predicted enzyme related to lactoylglutathione lyase